MQVLLIADSRHGAITEVAAAIAARLRSHGRTVTVARTQDALTVSSADAVIVGSPLYAGRCLTSVRGWVVRHEVELRERPVWLFSVGALGALASDCLEVSDVLYGARTSAIRRPPRLLGARAVRARYLLTRARP